MNKYILFGFIILFLLALIVSQTIPTLTIQGEPTATPHTGIKIDVTCEWSPVLESMMPKKDNTYKK